MLRMGIRKNVGNAHDYPDRDTEARQLVFPLRRGLACQIDLEFAGQFGPVCLAIFACPEPVIICQMLAPEMRNQYPPLALFIRGDIQQSGPGTKAA